jgi:two-component system, chemotaxis family, protein-glutamate methylesterase/glutaminase
MNRLKVLIVDDSAFARKVIREVLERDDEIDVVGYARDGLDALEKIAELKPDVITLDLIMPDLDGIGVLKALPRVGGPKVIIVSVSGADSDLVLEALELGAIDIVTKPTSSPTDRLYDLSSELALKIKAAGAAVSRVKNKIVAAEIPSISSYAFSGKIEIMVVGTSTGGPQAISEIFKTLPANFPVPLVFALHIPSGYTAPLAERVSRNSQHKLVEAYNGMELKAGVAVIAPGGLHLRIKKDNGKYKAIISREPEDSLYHPSINILFESAAEEAGSGAVGVILTGMGNDGSVGAAAIRAAGGKILAESASSCVVYGMPRSVIEAGVANEEAPIEKMTSLMIKNLL